MNLFLNDKIVDDYKSASQKIRVMTESWADDEIFCPSCGSDIVRFENSRPVADFFCGHCREEYELKSKKNTVGEKIVDGACRTMIERLCGDNNPNFFLLNYHPANYAVLNFFVIPKHFFIPAIIERRKPLSATARRAGWVGCNISLRAIPRTGKIFYVRDGKAEARSKILDDWQKTLFLRKEKNLSAKGWILDVMSCLDGLGKKEFRLDEVYAFEEALKVKHPDNKHIKDKIRQQLQFLRDKGYLTFVGRGKYKLA